MSKFNRRINLYWNPGK